MPGAVLPKALLCTAPISSTFRHVELVVRQPVGGLRADEAAVQPPPGKGGHHCRRATHADHAEVRQDVGASIGGAGHAERHGAGVGVSREPLSGLVIEGGREGRRIK